MNLFKILGKLFRLPWMRIPLMIIGVLCLIAAIWFGFPMIPLAIFSTIWLRASVIGVLLGLIALVQGLKWRKRRKLAQSMEAELTAEPQGDGKVLAERMSAALAKLKKSGGATYLYDLPWYVIIGPPGAGKTTALLNSGIEFPASESDQGGMQGFGGTRYCDWWFAEDAILIDTAGRYTTQDSDAGADSASWTAFLDLLKRSRPDQPINGVLLAFSVEDMMTATEDQLQSHAKIVRDRLGELHDRLRVDFPVYVLFTKCDLIAGFREYFSSFNVNRRKSVWGVTFQTKDRKQPTHEQVGPEFDALVSRLSDELIDRLSEEPDGISRVAIFGLPGQMALLRDNVDGFLRRVFAPSAHKTNALLRGFYFTSGTQEGTPIDQVLGAMAQTGSAGGGMAPSFMSGQGKSFFIHDLLKRVIFAESDWVSFDAGAVRRAALIRSASLTAMVLVTLGALGVFGWSAWQNHALVQETLADAGTYERTAQDEIARTEISDPDLLPILPLLDQLRVIPTGYGRTETATLWQGLGLGQRNRLAVAAATAYGDALEQMLRPRLILSVEQDLQALRREGTPADIYRALKVYMLLGGQSPQPEDAAIKAWFEDAWREDFTGTFEGERRDQLALHLDAMLALDGDREIAVAIDQATVTAARSAIVQMSLEDRAWALINDLAKASSLPDFNLTQALGPQADIVFMTQDGSDLDTVSVPGLFTFDGYWYFFFEEILTIADKMERDKWVLGEQADQVNFDGQLRGLEPALQARYGRAFDDAWDAMFNNLQLTNMSADPPQYAVLATASAEFSSPILLLAEAVDTQTRLSLELDRVAAEQAAAQSAGGGSGLVQNLTNIATSRFRQRSGAAERAIIDAAQDNKNQNRVNGEASGGLTNAIRQIERPFQRWHEIMAPRPDGNRAIDAVLFDLRAVHGNLLLARQSPQQAAQLAPQLLSNLVRNNASLPDPLVVFLDDAKEDFEAEASDATLADMNRALTNDITFTCRETITAAFPFTDTQRHLPPSAFGQFFGPGGAMDRYFTTYLAPHVIRGAGGWEPDPNSPLADRLSATTLRQFDRADKIRAAFFGAGGTNPEVQISVRHINNSSGVDRAQITINGTTMISVSGDPARAMTWPGAGGEAKVAIFINSAFAGGVGFEDGPWAIAKLMQRASRTPQGSGERMTFQIQGRSISYDVGFNALENPFMMPELRDFTCPQTLD